MTGPKDRIGILPVSHYIHLLQEDVGLEEAVVVLGGLLSSTVLNLPVMPERFRRFGGSGEG